MTQEIPFQRSAWGKSPLTPTAVQAFAEAHDTADSSPAGAGTGWIAHAIPFHRSATSRSSLYPTAVHTSAELHDTADRLDSPPYGRGWIVQATPFHASARATQQKGLGSRGV